VSERARERERERERESSTHQQWMNEREKESWGLRKQENKNNGERTGREDHHDSVDYYRPIRFSGSYSRES